MGVQCSYDYLQEYSHDRVLTLHNVGTTFALYRSDFTKCQASIKQQLDTHWLNQQANSPSGM